MGDSENEEQRVRPLAPTDSPGPRGRSSTLGVALAVVAGIAAFMFLFGSDADSEPDAQSAATALAVPEISTGASDQLTTTSPPAPASSTTAVLGAEQTLSDLLPDTEGVLIAVITSQAGLELVRWPPATPSRSSEIPMLSGPVLEFDASGLQMAFLGTSATAKGPALYLGRPVSWAPARVGVSSFKWHATWRGRIGWMELGESRRLCWADADPVGARLSASFCVASSGDELVGFDSSGFLVVDHDEGIVLRLDDSGQQVGSLPGSDALINRDGQVLIIDRNPDGREASFTLADPDLTNAVELDWAPPSASGEYGFVALSPSNHPPEVAFLVVPDEERRYELQLWTLDGTLERTVNLSGRVWDVEWDSTGRYLLAPGIVGERGHVLQVYDTFAQELLFLPYDNWIQDAQLVTPAVCENAAHVTAAFVDHLPPDVTLGTARMVLSRDADLESWYFMSARVVGGPFDGELASWAHPGFDGRNVDTTNTPGLAVPINEAAKYMGFGMTSLEPAGYGVNYWLQLDGALASQQCVQAEAPH